MSNKKQQKTNAVAPAFWGTLTGASTITTTNIFLSEPNFVNISASVLTGIVAIISAYKTYDSVKKINKIINTKNNQR